MIDILLIVLGIGFILSGLIGSIAPILPGPMLSLVGMIIIQYSQKVDFSSSTLIVFTLAVGLSIVLDYYLPLWGTKKYGGTKAGVVGSIVGMVAGLFLFPPLGIIILPFIGVFVAEYYISKLHGQAALRSARGSFVGFMLGTGYKLILCGWILIISLIQIFSY